MKTLNKEVGTGSQSVSFKEILEHKGKKLRIKIKSDSYRNQCYAKVCLFDGTKWNTIESIHYSHMATEKGLVYRPNLLPKESDFNTDRNRLVKLAKDVLD